MEFDSLVIGSGNGAYAPKFADTSPAFPMRNDDQTDALALTQPKAKEPKAKEQKASDAAEKADKEPQKSLLVTEDEIQKTINEANKKIEPLFLEFQHRIHSKTNRLIVSVVNTATKEVVREIPPEKTLDALAKMWELAGILLDQKG